MAKLDALDAHDLPQVCSPHSGGPHAFNKQTIPRNTKCLPAELKLLWRESHGRVPRPGWGWGLLDYSQMTHRFIDHSPKSGKTPVRQVAKALAAGGCCLIIPGQGVKFWGSNQQ